MATFLYYANFEHYSHCENWIASALDQNGHHCLRVQYANSGGESARLEQLIADNNVKYLLLSKAPWVPAESLDQLRNRTGVKIVMWTFDWMRHPSNWEWYGPQAKMADICFQTDGWAEQAEYSSEDIYRVELHQGCVPGLHDLPEFDLLPTMPILAPFHSDVTFIGSAYTNRRLELIQQLSKYHNFRKFGVARQVWGNAFARVCYLSKIVVGDNFVNDVAGYWSDRVYLTLACGGFFLTAYVAGLEREFTNHRHLVWWKDFNELHRLIDYYLPREAERRAIALEGYRLVHREHTYDRRIQRMTEELEKL